MCAGIVSARVLRALALFATVLTSFWGPSDIGWADQTDECVVLLHGLGRSKGSMSKLEEYLSRQGYHVVNYDYPSTALSIEQIAEKYAAEAVNVCRDSASSKIHFVTHSMGGIVVRQYLQDHSVPSGSRVVMLSPPNQGSELADALRDSLMFRWFMGPAGQQLGTDSHGIPSRLHPIGLEIGVITGNTSFEPWFSSLSPGPDDGKVSVERAKLDEMVDFLVVSSGHSLIMSNPEVMAEVAYFLAHGRFAHIDATELSN